MMFCVKQHGVALTIPVLCLPDSHHQARYYVQTYGYSVVLASPVLCHSLEGITRRKGNSDLFYSTISYAVDYLLLRKEIEYQHW